jgi:hypothetical protein
VNVGVLNKDYLAQRALLAKLDKGELQLADVQAKTKEPFDAELAKLNWPIWRLQAHLFICQNS